MELVSDRISVNAQEVGWDMIVLLQLANKNVFTMETALFLIPVLAKEAGVATIALRRCVHKNVIMVVYVLLQTHANVTNGKIHGEMAEWKEEFQCFRNQMVTHSLLVGRKYLFFVYSGCVLVLHKGRTNLQSAYKQWLRLFDPYLCPSGVLHTKRKHRVI